MSARPAFTSSTYVPHTVFAGGVNPWDPSMPSSSAHLGSSPFNHSYKSIGKSATLSSGPVSARAIVQAPATAPTPAPAPAAAKSATRKGGPGPAKGTICRGKVDMAALKIRKNVPLPTSVTTSSYAERFSMMEPTDCIECKPHEVVSVANAMRKWINEQRKNDSLQVISEKNDPKNPEVGHVWLWPKGDLKSLPPRSRGGVALGNQKRAKRGATE